jgi:hypothetical protein
MLWCWPGTIDELQLFIGQDDLQCRSIFLNVND